MQTQVPNRGKLSIKDCVIINHDSTNSFLRMLESKGVELLLFDAKNYKKPLTARAISVFKDYLRANRRYGDFGILLSKSGIAKNCDESIFRDQLTNDLVILVLEEADILRMLDKNDQGGEAADVLRDKYYEFIKQV